MPRRRESSAPPVVYRTARVGLRATGGQRRRLFGLLRSGGDVWAAVLLLNRWRRQRGDRPLVGYQELCRELAAAGEGTFGELSTVGARSVLRAYSDAWMSAARRRRAGDETARFPRRRRGLVPVRFYAGTFTVDGGRVRLPVARGRPPLWVRLARPLPYPDGQVRSVRLTCAGRRLFLEVTAEVPVTVHPAGAGPDPARVAGVDLGIIHPYAALAPRGGEGGRDAALLVSGRALRAEHRLHLAEAKARTRAAARRAPAPGRRGSRRWKQFRRRTRALEGRHRRRLAQARHEAAKAVVSWAVAQRIGTLAVGDPRGVLGRDAGRRQNKAVRDWAVGDLLRALADKAEQSGIVVEMVDERGTSSTCPACAARVAKPRGRVFHCRRCRFTGHRDLVGAANIAARASASAGAASGGSVVTGSPPVTTHRRAGRHLPGAGRSRRDPRRGLISRPPGRPIPTDPVVRGGGSIWPAVARPGTGPGSGESLAGTRREDQAPPHRGEPCLTRH
ncbi:RNA-guided endonuclease TnpB family protein [Blastococcus sp. DSM 46786]|uniref:RNA-guided endonuclease InsQ/TnpB family protein n=1 Tax=Blastococcus sp. DSM 46786 TaxID=1798227 RepID=UPI00111403DA|nr:RNA-guided endonuclease TnpB family protein [Blastococcus sp. DSM 46786]